MRLLSLLVAASLLSGATARTPVSSPWVMTWSDEFNGADGTSPDPAKWVFDIGGRGWGNKELESYTSRTMNAQQHGGDLVITALKEDYTGTDGIARPTPRRV